MSVVFASPGAVSAPPPVVAKPFRGLGMTWTGWDGSVWPLTQRRTGLFITNDGVEGLDTPPWEVYKQSSPGVHGSQPRGYKVQERPVFWPLFTYANDSQSWMQRDRALWNTMRPLKYGTWTVEHPTTQEKRYLRCRFDGDPQGFKNDPFRKGWTPYGMSLVADKEPFWLGDPVTRRFVADAPEDFFNGTLNAPEFRISSGSNMTSAQVNNPGDMEAWPVWTIEGPTSTVRVGLNGLQVVVPFAVLDGQVVTIDTRPHMQIATRQVRGSNGVLGPAEEVTHLLGAADFVAIPEGQNISLDLEVVGTGSIRCTFEPRYLRAW